MFNIRRSFLSNCALDSEKELNTPIMHFFIFHFSIFVILKSKFTYLFFLHTRYYIF